ncbi:hypothetical protein [Paenibacillus sp. V4I5]|uniref:hypothetical protein n=1 Tax=Paenibacillus sp. V4I5 TaxID=3042306 RepID=UPI00278CF81C|nr:hypothetical protein [Paenibacillus sp. V4I5]MDQ0916529.1 hypothetical protein [Paenibacillus sp. V4I5]
MTRSYLEKAILKNNDLTIMVLAEVQERSDEFGNEFPFFFFADKLLNLAADAFTEGYDEVE